MGEANLPQPPQKNTRGVLLGFFIGGGIALISGLCVFVLSAMFFFALWNDGSNDMSFVMLWGLSSLLGGGLAALAVGLVLGGGAGWYVYRKF